MRSSARYDRGWPRHPHARHARARLGRAKATRMSPRWFARCRHGTIAETGERLLHRSYLHGKSSPRHRPTSDRSALHARKPACLPRLAGLRGRPVHLCRTPWPLRRVGCRTNSRYREQGLATPAPWTEGLSQHHRTCNGIPDSKPYDCFLVFRQILFGTRKPSRPPLSLPSEHCRIREMIHQNSASFSNASFSAAPSADETDRREALRLSS